MTDAKQPMITKGLKCSEMRDSKRGHVFIHSTHAVILNFMGVVYLLLQLDHPLLLEKQFIESIFKRIGHQSVSVVGAKLRSNKNELKLTPNDLTLSINK